MEVLNELCDLVAAHPDLLLADKLTWLSSRCAPPAAAPHASRAHLHSLIALERLLPAGTPAAPAPVPHLPGFPRLPVAVLLAAVLRPHALPLQAPPPPRRRSRLPRPLVRPLHRPPRRARRCRPRLPHGRVVPLNVRRDPTLLKFEDLGAIASNGVNGSRKSCSGGTCTSGSGIQGDFNLNNFEDGVLSSAFMVGLLVASPIFASLAKIHNPFRLIGVGLLVWTIATAGCGCSFDFWSITICRMLVGVGEASFISLAAPFIDDSVVRIGLPSKGRMSEQTLSLLKVPNLEVWFQRPADIVRKLQSGDLDLGIVGFDIVSEYGQSNR